MRAEREGVLADREIGVPRVAVVADQEIGVPGGMQAGQMPSSWSCFVAVSAQPRLARGLAGLG